MNLTHHIVQLVQDLPPEKQTEVLDFVKLLVARQKPNTWTVEQRRAIVNQTMGSLADTQTSSDAFAGRKQEEKAREQRRWKTGHSATA